MTDWWLRDNSKMTDWWLPDDYLMTAWWLPDDCLMTAWWLPKDFLRTAWGLHNDCMISQRWLPHFCVMADFNYKYCTCALITFSWLQTAFEFWPYIRTELPEKRPWKQRNGLQKWLHESDCLANTISAHSGRQFDFKNFKITTYKQWSKLLNRKLYNRIGMTKTDTLIMWQLEIAGWRSQYQKWMEQ